jgi:hypothetical protein
MIRDQLRLAIYNDLQLMICDAQFAILQFKFDVLELAIFDA